MVELYIRYECPFCQRVLGKVEELGLKQGKDFKIIEAGAGTPGRDVILKIGGKGQVPFMMDGRVHMYESSDIIEYIEKKFAK
jgi:glutathione S-transferase